LTNQIEKYESLIKDHQSKLLELSSHSTPRQHQKVISGEISSQTNIRDKEDLDTVKNLMPSQKMMYIKNKAKEEEDSVKRVTEKTKS
jgi:phosphoenolpyruvate synthase/pyruvate phosphate dikinase